MASESSFYRVLNSFDQVHHRGRTRVLEKRAAPTSYTATGPNQLWSWDITYCGSTVRGQYYYLYLIEDIYSRKIVGWEVHDEESGELAAALLLRTVIREQCFKQPLVLHSDNGAPMKSLTFKAKMEELGITGSYSRPRVGVLQGSCHLFLVLCVCFMRLSFAPPAQADPGLGSLLLYAPSS